MNRKKDDHITKAIAAYIREINLPIDAVAQGTGISRLVLTKSFENGTRRLHVEEFLNICRFLKKDPRDFCRIA